MKYFFSILFLLILSGCSRNDEKVKITFEVQSATPIDDKNNVYISGNNEALAKWRADKIKLTRINDNTFRYSVELEKNETVEYKFTLGSWESEALDSAGAIPVNNKLTAKHDSIVVHKIRNWHTAYKEGKLILTSSMFRESSPSIGLYQDWNYTTDDNPAFADPEFDDSNWKKAPSILTEDSTKWDGQGWFRYHLWIDESLWDKQLAFLVFQMGASEVYFNGKLIKKTGAVSQNEDLHKSELNRDWRLITFDKKHHQVIAVRYSVHSLDFIRATRYGPGFYFYFNNANFILSHLITVNSIYQIIFTIIPFVLFLFHLILFSFYTKEKQNLFYAFCLFGFSLIAFINYVGSTTSYPFIIVYLYRLLPSAVSIAIFFGLLTVYAGTFSVIPGRWKFFAALGLIIGVIGFIFPTPFMFATVYIYFFVSLFEITRFFLKQSLFKEPSSWFSLAGFSILIVSVIFQLLIDYAVIDPPLGINIVLGFGVMGLAIFMSLSLAYKISKTNKNLQEQLVNVRILNEAALEQERESRRIEVERKLLEADNRRKTRELEDAKSFQIAMLPKNIPALPYCDIAVFMKAASEVGGDYYDFYIDDENSLTTFIGDATGHGTKAGMMVAVTKSLFSVLAPNPSPLSIIKKITSAIKSMRLHNLYMSLIVAKIKDRKLTYSNAGMPPGLLYKCKSGTIERLIQKSMPLGSFVNFPYYEKEIELEAGDTLLFMSDGFMEAFNNEGDLLGLDNSEKFFGMCADLTPTEIIEKLKSDLEVWNGNNHQNDDVTLVVIKIK